MPKTYTQDGVLMVQNDTTSPKVLAGGISGAAAVVVVAMLTAITPDMLDWAGRFTPVIYAGIGSLATVLAVYGKRDRDRDFDVPEFVGERTDVDSEDAAEIDAYTLNAGTVDYGDVDDTEPDGEPDEGYEESPVPEVEGGGDSDPEGLSDDELLAAIEPDASPPPADYQPKH